MWLRSFFLVYPQIIIQYFTEVSVSQTTEMTECVTCEFTASTAEELRCHYKSDHHRYNCRRSVYSVQAYVHM